jgi:hypothetical protein
MEASIVAGMSVVVDREIYEQAERLRALRYLRRRRASEHPAFLMQFMHCIDAKTGEEFDFDLLTPQERHSIGLGGEPGKWFWHRGVLESWITQEVSLEYKSRQIGVTWLAAGYGLALALRNPGTRILIISINLEEAQKVIARIWGMYLSLPDYLREHLELTKPSRGGAPSQEIEWTDPKTAKRSSILALPSTPKAGHGETAALVILDEFARQDFARESWKAAFPIIDGGGRAVIISTANGVSSEDTEGEAQGNFFHYLWVNAESMRIDRRFFDVFTHPDRDQNWYETSARRLPPSDRAEMYPRTPEEGFISSGKCWFDLEKLNSYQERWRKEKREYLYRMDMVDQLGFARINKHKNGGWRIYEEPKDGHTYAIAADVATGSGDDFSAAFVIDLSNGRWVAEYHAKIQEDMFGVQLYFVARRYNDALVAVETQGGYGRATIISMRTPIKGRKPYTKMYRHRIGPEETIDPDDREGYGFPMNQATRPLVINGLEEWIRDGLCPWISPDLDAELRTFSKRNTRPSPRALDGCNDDRVMAAGVSLEMYRLYGHHEKRRRRKPQKSRWKNAMYPHEVRA